DGIRDLIVTGVQTCALPIWPTPAAAVVRRTVPGRFVRTCPAGSGARVRGRPARVFLTSRSTEARQTLGTATRRVDPVELWTARSADGSSPAGSSAARAGSPRARRLSPHARSGRLPTRVALARRTEERRRSRGGDRHGGGCDEKPGMGGRRQRPAGGVRARRAGGAGAGGRGRVAAFSVGGRSPVHLGADGLA